MYASISFYPLTALEDTEDLMAPSFSFRSTDNRRLVSYAEVQMMKLINLTYFDRNLIASR